LLPRFCLFGYCYWLYYWVQGIKIRLFSRSSIGALAEQTGWQLIKAKKCGLFSLAVLLGR
jgi:hypothetical protein